MFYSLLFPNLLFHIMTDIKSVKIKVSDLYTIYFDIVFATDWRRGDQFQIFCYDSSYTRMVTDASSMRVGVCRNRLLARCTSDYAFTEGRYMSVVSAGGKPSFRICFSLSADGFVSAVDVLRLTPAMSEYVLVDRLEADNLANTLWKGLCETPGMPGLKRLALRHICWKLFNDRRDTANLRPLLLSLHHIVFTDTPLAAVQTVKRFARLVMSDWEVKSADLSSLLAEKNPQDAMSRFEELFESSSTMVVLYGIDSLLWGDGIRFARYIERQMDMGPGLGVVFLGGASTVDALREKYPLMMSHVLPENTVRLEALGIGDFLHGVEGCLAARDFRLAPDAVRELLSGLRNRYERGILPVLTLDMVQKFTDRGLLDTFARRMLDGEHVADNVSAEEMKTLVPTDINWEVLAPAAGSADSALRSLDAMIGLASVKRVVADLATLERYAVLCRQQGMDVPVAANHHMIFTGNPGTGKTTVAKRIGKIFHALGVLSKGDVIVLDRSSIVGRFIGETEQNMLAILARARGNVLFIDEAYNLCTDTESRTDYGHRIIECLLAVLARPHADMVVIMAGYQDEMDRMLDSNPGLRGRFAHYLHFDDYSSEELLEIARKSISARGMLLPAAAEAQLLSTIERVVACKGRGFSNARWAEMFVDKLMAHVARRVMSSQVYTADFLVTVTPDDVLAAGAELALPKIYAKPHIGFA